MRYDQEGNKLMPTVPIIDDDKAHACRVINKYLLSNLNIRNPFDFFGIFGDTHKLSSYGTKFIENASLFLDTEVDTSCLRSASDLIEKQLPELYKYSPSAEIMGQQGNFEFDATITFIGEVHGDGKSAEKRPSGYSAFVLTQEDRNDYTDCLIETLDESYPLLKRGFKADRDNETFRTVLNSFVQSDEIDMRNTKIINDFVSEVGHEAFALCESRDSLKKHGLEDIYKKNLNPDDLAENLRNSGFRVMYGPSEFFSSHFITSAIGGSLGGAVVLTYLTPYSIPAGLAGLVLLAGGVIGVCSNYTDRNIDIEALRNLETHGYWKQ